MVKTFPSVGTLKRAVLCGSEERHPFHLAPEALERCAVGGLTHPPFKVLANGLALHEDTYLHNLLLLKRRENCYKSNDVLVPPVLLQHLYFCFFIDVFASTSTFRRETQNLLNNN